MPDWTRTAISTATVAFQDFPNQRVRGVLREKQALLEAAGFEV